MLFTVIACQSIANSYLSMPTSTGIFRPALPNVMVQAGFLFTQDFVVDLQYCVTITDQNTTAFKEVAIIRHPRVGEYAFGFITSSVVLQVREICSLLSIP